MTNKLLLEAGIGTSSYQWAGKERDPNPTRDLVRVVNNGQVFVPATATTPAVTGNMTYRSQNWYKNRTAGVNWTASGTYVTGSHSMKFGYQGYWWKDDRQMFVNSQSLQYTFNSGVPKSHRAVPQRVQGERARDVHVVLRAGPVDARPIDVAGRAPIRQSVELVPRGGRAGEPLLRRRQLPAGGWRHRLPRHHAAHGCRVRSVRKRQDLTEGEPWEVPPGRQREQPRLRREPGAANPRRRHYVRRDVRALDEPQLDGQRPRLRSGLRSEQSAGAGSDDHRQRRHLRSDQQPRVRRHSDCRRQLRSRVTVWLGRSSVGLVVRRFSAAGDHPARVRGSRLLPALVHSVHYQRHGDRQPCGLAE